MPAVHEPDKPGERQALLDTYGILFFVIGILPVYVVAFKADLEDLTAQVVNLSL